MIDFLYLNKLIDSARNPDDGKPLDKVNSLHGRWVRGSGMRSTRLFRVSDPHWRVELHGNVIARIARQRDNSSVVTIESVNQWPTMTTAERLSSVLGVNVWKQDNKLRANFNKQSNDRPTPRSFRQFPPLVDGQKFHITAAGVYCINPEIVTETRIRVRTEPSKPVLAYLKKIKQLGTVIAKVGSLGYADIRFNDRVLLPMDTSTEVDDELVRRIMGIGTVKCLPTWGRIDRARNNRPVEPHAALKYLDAGLRHYKDNLYTHHGVYERYTFSFKDQFKGARDGDNDALAIAA